MGELLTQDKEIAVPGQVLAEGLDYLPSFGTLRDENSIIATRLGMVSVHGRTLKIVPLAGRYSPIKDDIIVGKVVDVTFSGWQMDINCPYIAMLSTKEATSEFIQRGADLTRYFMIGDFVAVKIVNVTSQKLIDLSVKGPGLRKLDGGRILKVGPNKVPRIIGKQGSMVSMIKDATGCKIVVGQNGIVWIDGEPEKENIAVETIRKIEAESHISGLTERIKKFLAEKGGTQ